MRYRSIIMIAIVLFASSALMAAVTLTDLGSEVKLDNGIVSACWKKSNGRLTSLTQGGVELLGNGGSGYVLGVCNGKKISTNGTTYSLVRDTESLKEISFKRVAHSSFPMTFDLRFVMRSGDSGIYVYQVLEHDADDGIAKLSHFRDAYRLDPNIFTRVYIEDGRVFDEPEPARHAVAIPQHPKEAIKLTDGSIYYKYLRSNYLKDADVYGWAGGGRGAWMVRPSREFINGGPTKQHICAHQTDTTPVMITHAISGHYGSGGMKLDSTDGAWKKVIGPYMIYLNKAADPDKAWADAKAKLKTEENSWPYGWMSHPNYTLAAGRGTVTGKLNITDGSSVAGAFVILAQPTDGTADTNWQRQGKDYIFWTEAAADGSFTIEKVRPGKYTLYSNVSGVLDEYELDGVTVKAGGTNTLGQLNWTPRKHGKLIWQIGTADRSAAEYRHGDDFRRYGLWFEYPKDFPNGVTYTIGKSKPATDWNFNQWCVKNSSGGYDLSPWTIKFDMDEITGDQAVLTVAIAAARSGRLKVLVNDVVVLKNDVLIYDMAAHRAGIRGFYRERIIKFDSSILSTTSTNKIVLMQTRAGLFQSIMYDCIRLEVGFAEEKTTREDTSDQNFRTLLDSPLLFIKRYSYTGIHIYDTFYKWPVEDKGNGQGVGGIYILENPSAPRDQWKIRTVIDGTTEGGLGNGVYSHPDISYDCGKVIFCYKATAAGCTMIYEIDIDGGNLQRLTDPTSCLANYKGVKSGIHDLSPTYLPDGRIVFLSTRPAGLVPCANEGVSILHVMNADGSDIHPISVNSETEFDPMVLPDGRIVFGRWEYIDKTALTVQSLWTIYPDGSNGTAMYGNNMVFPEAILDPRPVPGTGLIAATLSKHNASPRGTIAMIDPFAGKNDPAAIYNFENKNNPTHDVGNSCEPYPLSKDVMIYSGRAKGAKRNSIMMINRKGERTTLLSDANISLHAPMLVRPRSARTLPQFTDRSKTTGTFYVQNVYDGLKGVKPGEAKWLRIIEESSRVSASPGSNIFNQTFSISAALAFSAKIYHGMVPIYEDGSAYFEAPSGRLIFFQVLDKDKRLIQSMRTFIQAAPGTTRSCIGCHEKKTNAPTSLKPIPKTLALKNPPSAPQPESWGSGYMDYSTLIQPIWDKNCVSCHGGEKKFAGRLDLTGGWTEFFSNSYENLVDRRHTQLVPYYIAGIDCMNGTAHYSVPLFPPKSFGSAVAPLAKVIASGHKGRIKNLTDIDSDLIMAWIDSNGLYFGTWDYTKFGPRLTAWVQTREKLTQVMNKAKCYSCHDKHFGGDWINLRKPEFSRILRAPLAKGDKGMGLAICQNHKTDPKRNRINLLRGGYQHAVKDLSFYAAKPIPDLKEGGIASPTFASVDDPLWQEMLAIIRDGRKTALEQARVDMPGAELIAGKNRMMVPPPVPNQGPALKANADQAGVVSLQWQRPASIIGLTYEVHRSDKENFSPDETTLIAQTELPKIIDKTPPVGTNYYALVVAGKDKRSRPSRTKVTVKAQLPRI